jgi:predicted amidohydrolase YtcJ
VKTVLKLLASLVLVLGLAGWWFLVPSAPPEHRVFINGQVLSMDGDNRIFEAISLRGDRVHRLGSTEEILGMVGDDTIVTDLEGNTLMPGIIDAHGHFPGSALYSLFADLNSPPIGNVRSIADIQDRLRVQLEKVSGDEWVAGWSYDDTLIAENRHPTRHDLDAVSKDLPIYIVHVSGHMGVANTRALELLGINAQTPDPVGGVIVREPGTNVPAGLLEETAHFSVAESVLAVSTLDGIRMVMFASDEYIAQGVTTAQSGGVDASMGPALAQMATYNLIKPRIVIFPFYHMLGQDLLSGEFDPASVESAKAIVGPVKIVADGSIQGYTGYLTEPYHVPFKGDAEYRGYPAVPREELIKIVSQFHGAGIQLAIHGNGDASIDDILDAFELAQAENPVEDPRLIVIHSQMARDDQLVRMKELGVTPSFFSAHTYYWGDRHRDIFMGPERAARMSPAKSAENIGLRYSVHLDTPVVPMQPMQMLWSTVNRRTTSGAEIGPEQRVSPMNALRAMTIDAAWQVFQDENIGSLESGKLADIVILDGDPLTAEDVREIEVVETIVGGSSVYLK